MNSWCAMFKRQWSYAHTERKEFPLSLTHMEAKCLSEQAPFENGCVCFMYVEHSCSIVQALKVYMRKVVLWKDQG